MALKHVGRIKSNKRKVCVAYRTIPGDAESAVIVTTENLEAGDHDALMRLIESNTGQTANELADAMMRTQLPDGSNMLARFHATGKMMKVATKDIEMVPDNKTVINLAELNQVIATQKGVSIEDLAIKDGSAVTKKVAAPMEVVEEVVSATAEAGVLTDEQLAAQYRSQADAMYKEAKRLREEAESLVPTIKATKKTTTSA
tara:strand:+ start:5171 stop:5773 length:603 start_codon:yes stop_codon:yes gene_type:complete